MPALPIVRHFLACERIEVNDPASHERLVRLTNPWLRLEPVQDETYIRQLDEFWLYAVLTGGHGIVKLTLSGFFVHESYPPELFPAVDFAIDFGQDRLAVHEWVQPIRNLAFFHPGAYQFQRQCGKEVLGSIQLVLDVASR